MYHEPFYDLPLKDAKQRRKAWRLKNAIAQLLKCVNGHSQDTIEIYSHKLAYILKRDWNLS